MLTGCVLSNWANLILMNVNRQINNFTFKLAAAVTIYSFDSLSLTLTVAAIPLGVTIVNLCYV